MLGLLPQPICSLIPPQRQDQGDWQGLAVCDFAQGTRPVGTPQTKTRCARAETPCGPRKAIICNQDDLGKLSTLDSPRAGPSLEEG